VNITNFLELNLCGGEYLHHLSPRRFAPNTTYV